MTGSCNNSRSSGVNALVVASKNQNKFFEIRAAIGVTAIPLQSLRDFPEVPDAPESGETFGENALQKANFYFEHLRRLVLAEDSGLVIPALDGYPGIHSARIAADDASRISIVLQRMTELEGELRRAYYVCNLVIKGEHGMIQVEGRCDGILTTEPKGSLGFGYDPIFLPDGARKTFGEMSIKEKSHYSHRARAIELALPFLLRQYRANGARQ